MKEKVNIMKNNSAAFIEAIAEMDLLFVEIEGKIKSPKKINHRDRFTFRYEESGLCQAIILKLARYISSLRAAYLLLQNGFLQEQGALQRTLDEFHEDIVFLSYGVLDETLTPRHQQFLDAFFQEEFSDDGPVKTDKQRNLVPRKKIRAYIADIESQAIGTTTAATTGRVISTVYSGYVHAAGPHLMEMYYGNPPSFHLAGQSDSDLFSDHLYDIWNYFFRGFLSLEFSANACDDSESVTRVAIARKKFCDQTQRMH